MTNYVNWYGGMDLARCLDCGALVAAGDTETHTKYHSDKTRNTDEVLKETIKVAHEAMGDLTHAIKQARGVLKQIDLAAQKSVDERLGPVIEAKITELGVVTKDAMNKSVDKVTLEFTRLENILLGKEPRDIKKGKPSIEELIERSKK